MKILIIYAHPNHKSFNGSVLEQVKGNIRDRHQVQVLDLYAENFNPVLHFDEENLRRDLDKDPEMAKYREMVSWADHLIFIFPVWWSGMPAILKGFIDRVFASGFAYSYKGMGMQGHLTGKTAWVITTHNTPSFFTHFVQDYGKVLKGQVLAMCGIKPCKLTSLAYLRGADLEKRKRMLAHIAEEAQKM